MLNVKKLLAKITDSFIVEEYMLPNVSWAAGTIGTRGTVSSVDITKTGYTPVSATICYIPDSSTMNPHAFFSSDLTKVYVAYYRASSGAITNVSGVKVRVRFIKD